MAPTKKRSIADCSAAIVARIKANTMKLRSPESRKPTTKLSPEQTERKLHNNKKLEIIRRERQRREEFCRKEREKEAGREMEAEKEKEKDAKREKEAEKEKEAGKEAGSGSGKGKKTGKEAGSGSGKAKITEKENEKDARPVL